MTSLPARTTGLPVHGQEVTVIIRMPDGTEYVTVGMFDEAVINSDISYPTPDHYPDDPGYIFGLDTARVVEQTFTLRLRRSRTMGR